MNTLDWIVMSATLAFIVIYGIYKTRQQSDIDSYFRGGNSPWWLIGLSVMATQASAITFISTPGLAYESGMGFVQFYFGLPLAMIVICVWFIPIFHKLKVFTAYQFLEDRFNLKTRSLAAFLFLVQRGLAAGITIYAPSIILCTFLGWNLTYTNIAIGLLVIIYTVTGGTQAVSQTQKQQMIVIMTGMAIAFYLALDGIPETFSFSDKWQIAKASGKTQVIDWSFDLNNRYNIWSGLTGGFFLALSYFGTDQSQVARYLSGRNLKEMRLGLIFNGLLKIPMQFFILLVGVMVFVFLQFNPGPSFYNENAFQTAKNNPEYASQLEVKNGSIQMLQSNIKSELEKENIDYSQIEILNQKIDSEKAELKSLIKAADENLNTKDSDYVFLYFIKNYLPHGIIGLLLAVILSAAMSSTSSEINALASISMVDFHERFRKEKLNDKQKVLRSKLFTFAWGIMAIIFSISASLFDNLIEAVNILGSLFYGTILGIFLVAFWFKKIMGNAVFIAALIAESIVITLFLTSELGYLWFNVIGCLLVIVLAYIIQKIIPQKNVQTIN